MFQCFRTAYIPLEKNSFGWECRHSCTACCTSSSDLKDLHPIASLSGPKTWKSLGARSGEYDGCGRHSKDRSWIVTTVERAVQDWALSCWSKTPVLRGPHRLDLIAGHRWFFRRSAYVVLVSVPPGHVVLQNYPSFIPKASQHNLSRRWLCVEFFRFWWGSMAPFLTRFFRLVVVDPGFISLTILPRKPSPSASKRFKSSWQASARRSFNFAVSWRGTHLADTLWNCSTSWTIWCADPWLLSICAAISVSYAAIFLYDGFNCCNDLRCHYPVCLTRSRRVCYRTNAVHELPSPLVHLLQWQTCITILNFHLSMNFDGFHPFTD